MKASLARGVSATRHIHVDRERVVGVETTIARLDAKALKAGFA